MGVTDFVNSKACDKPVHEVVIYIVIITYTCIYTCRTGLMTSWLIDVQVIREMTDGAGVDYSFECTGINDVLREAFLSTHDVLLLRCD